MSRQASSTGSLSSATANSSATINPFSIGGPVSGEISSDGNIDFASGGTFSAMSSAAMEFSGGRLFTAGSLEYAPFLSAALCSATIGCAPEPYGNTFFDPVTFEVNDLATGTLTTGTLFEVSGDLSGSAGSWSWGGDMFTLSAAASDFDFHIAINSPFTIEQGAADLQVRNGIITTSDGTGLFAGIFPAVGTPGVFSVPFDTNFSLDYNLGNFNGDPLDVTFTLGNGGSASNVPEPATSVLISSALLLSALADRVRRQVHRFQLKKRQAT